MCDGNVLKIFFFTGRRIENDVVDGLDQFQLYDAFDCENLKETIIWIRFYRINGEGDSFSRPPRCHLYLIVHCRWPVAIECGDWILGDRMYRYSHSRHCRLAPYDCVDSTPIPLPRNRTNYQFDRASRMSTRMRIVEGETSMIILRWFHWSWPYHSIQNLVAMSSD